MKFYSMKEQDMSSNYEKKTLVYLFHKPPSQKSPWTLPIKYIIMLFYYEKEPNLRYIQCESVKKYPISYNFECTSLSSLIMQFELLKCNNWRPWNFILKIIIFCIFIWNVAEENDHHGCFGKFISCVVLSKQ